MGRSLLALLLRGPASLLLGAPPVSRRACGTCAHFSAPEPSTKQWGDCLRGKPILVVELRENQHRDNGKTCPGYVVVRRARRAP